MEFETQTVITAVVALIVIIALIYLKSTLDATRLEMVVRAVIDRLMSDHAMYTRLFIVASTDKSVKETTGLVARLMTNQEDIGNGLRPMIGDDLADKLTATLKEHIKYAGQTIGAAVSGDESEVEKSVALLKENSDKTAKIISKINPAKLPEEVTTKLFWEHNQYVIDQTIARISGDYAKDVALYDEYYGHMLMIGNAIANGVLA